MFFPRRGPARYLGGCEGVDGRTITVDHTSIPGMCFPGEPCLCRWPLALNGVGDILMSEWTQ
jgi:hypothetical protein